MSSADVAPSRSKVFVAVFVAVVGLVVLIPNAIPLVAHWRADWSQAVTARWVGSQIATSARDTVGVPAFAFERRIGPLVQDCRVDLVKYRHAPGGRPRFETLTVVAGATCQDLQVREDPPTERIPLAIAGILTTFLGLGLLVVARRRRG